MSKAKVFKSRTCRGFVGFGDADPTNVSPTVRGAEMRVAETRAVSRALRKTYGIGLCSVEEIGPAEQPRTCNLIQPGLAEAVPSRDGQPRLRDRLLLLIRQFGLDGEQVKRYALDFCGTAMLRDASREQVERLVDHLAMIAAEGQARLSEQLAPYAQPRNQGREEEAA